MPTPFLGFGPGVMQDIEESLHPAEQYSVVAQLDLIESTRSLPADAVRLGPPFRGTQLRVVHVGKLRLYFIQRRHHVQLMQVARGLKSTGADRSALARFRLATGQSP